MTRSADAEYRAYQMLQWNPYSLPTEFDWELAALGHYTKLQDQRSDEALDSFDKAHAYQASSELSAFRELERLGVITQVNFFSPSKAADGYYAKRLKEYGTVSSSPQRDSRKAEQVKKPRRRRGGFRNTGD